MERKTKNKHSARGVAGEIKLLGLKASLSLLANVQTVRLERFCNLGYFMCLSVFSIKRTFNLVTKLHVLETIVHKM